ncbi:NUDIX hydrolase [Streptomyces thermolilacinus]|uniref:NUDIX hydrolase n=1 Tax=Streptomyces thermolilacinus TaxID=285540 RepID=UPI0033F39998
MTRDPHRLTAPDPGGTTGRTVPTTPAALVLDAGVEVPEPRDGETWTVGAVILDGRGRAFAQRRGPHRRLFPDCWDIVGGHVEPGESLLEALVREVAEETGWRARRVRRLLCVSTWTGDDGVTRREADYLVEVDGDLDAPVLEWPEHTAYAWLGRDDLSLLKENRQPGEYLVHDLIAHALRPAPSF